MKLRTKYMFLLALSAALSVSCGEEMQTDQDAFPMFYDISTESAPGSTSVTIKSSYLLYGSDAVGEVGIRYAESGSSEFTYVPADGISNQFKVLLTGLEPSTSYIANAYIKTVSGKEFYGEPACPFTTAAKETDPEPIRQFLWGELPEIKEMDDVVYVAHYVSSNGQSDASSATPGRVRNYSICYDKQKLQPLWVAYPMHSWYSGKAGRNEDWKYDPYISKDIQPKLGSSYTGGFSRGHQIASSDRQASEAMNKQTFYYTNISPQIQNPFNGGIWLKLENKVKGWGFGWSDTLYVVTGSAFMEDKGYAKDNNDKSVPVPSHFYKVLLSSKTGTTGKPVNQLDASELRCVGFWLSHYGHANNAPITKEFMMSVSDIEELTGFTFFPMLSGDAAGVKDSYNASEWGM